MTAHITLTGLCYINDVDLPHKGNVHSGERESVAAEHRVVLQWQTRVLERETEWRCNGRRECCSGRPSRVAMVDKSAVAAGDRVALQWVLSAGGRGALQQEELHCKQECCNGS